MPWARASAIVISATSSTAGCWASSLSSPPSASSGTAFQVPERGETPKSVRVAASTGSSTR